MSEPTLEPETVPESLAYLKEQCLGLVKRLGKDGDEETRRVARQQAKSLLAVLDSDGWLVIFLSAAGVVFEKEEHRLTEKKINVSVEVHWPNGTIQRSKEES